MGDHFHGFRTHPLGILIANHSQPAQSPFRGGSSIFGLAMIRVII
jgi:hypothetical protein